MTSMKNTTLLTLLFIFPILLQAQEFDAALMENAKRIHAEAIVFDAHAHPKPYNANTLVLGEKTPSSDVDLISMKEGGLDAIIYSMPMFGSNQEDSPAYDLIHGSIRSLKDQVRKNHSLAELALNAGDVERIHQSGKRSVLLSIEANPVFSGKLEYLADYYRSGIRCINLRHSLVDPIADTPDEEPGDAGLSKFGKQVIQEMNNLGMLIDITHTPDNLQRDIIKTSTSPVVATHSNCRTLQNVSRNIPDDIIKAMSEQGGGIMITFFPGYVSGTHPEDQVPLESLIDHIDHAVKVAGIDHVGFGSDFLGSDTHTMGLKTVSDLPKVTYHLLKRGYSEGDIKKILGGNLLRILREVQSKRVD